MKNFLELTAIKPKLQLELNFKIHGELSYIVTVNGSKCYPGINIVYIDLLDPILIESHIISKINDNSAVEIIKACANNYDFLPIYRHLASNGDTWHNYIGKWQYHINIPFYVWYHEVSGQGWIA